MFGNLIYYNKKKIDQYSTLIQGEPIKAEESIAASHNNKATNYLLECSKFESLLRQRDDYIDFVDSNSDITIKDVRVSSIIRVSGEIYVPEQFDMIHLIEQYKPLLLSQVECKDAEERALLDAVFGNSKMRIPVYCELGAECDFWMGIGKISPDDLLIEYNELEEQEGKEFTILAKLEARKYYRGKPLPVFDIYKDFLGLNRALRKQLTPSQKQEFESIDVEEDYLALEILAIY
jgi:hypothetical protein